MPEMKLCVFFIALRSFIRNFAAYNIQLSEAYVSYPVKSKVQRKCI